LVGPAGIEPAIFAL